MSVTWMVSRGYISEGVELSCALCGAQLVSSVVAEDTEWASLTRTSILLFLIYAFAGHRLLRLFRRDVHNVGKSRTTMKAAIIEKLRRRTIAAMARATIAQSSGVHSMAQPPSMSRSTPMYAVLSSLNVHCRCQEAVGRYHVLSRRGYMDPFSANQVCA